MAPDAPIPYPRLRFLGTGTSTGVPSFFCDCPACEEARQNPRLSRGCSSVLIQSESGGTPHNTPQNTLHNTLIDTAPELREQLNAAQVRDIDALLFTHEHHDHVAGLGALEYYSKLRRKQPLPVYATEQVISYLKIHFDFMAECLAFIAIKPFEPFELGGITYLGLPATHNPHALGYLIQGSTAYFPDSARLAPEVEARVRGIGTIIFDATFNGSNWMPKAHMTTDTAVSYLQELDCGRGYLTHLALSYDTPITAAQLDERLAPLGGRIQAAYDGLAIPL